MPQHTYTHSYNTHTHIHIHALLGGTCKRVKLRCSLGCCLRLGSAWLGTASQLRWRRREASLLLQSERQTTRSLLAAATTTTTKTTNTTTTAITHRSCFLFTIDYCSHSRGELAAASWIRQSGLCQLISMRRYCLYTCWGYIYAQICATLQGT